MVCVRTKTEVSISLYKRPLVILSEEPSAAAQVGEAPPAMRLPMSVRSFANETREKIGQNAVEFVGWRQQIIGRYTKDPGDHREFKIENRANLDLDFRKSGAIHVQTRSLKLPGKRVLSQLPLET